jgi:hypothetical protein
MLCGLALTTITQATVAAHPPPAVGTVGLKGVVPGKPPGTAAVITSPKPGARFSAIPIPVSGTCPINTIVELFKNGVFAGSDYCKDDGTFIIQADLIEGQNDLVARVYDALDQAGPDSNSVTIFYDAPVNTAALFSVPSANALPDNYVQFLLRTNAIYRGSFSGDTVHVVVDIIGGALPYALILDWGDGKTDLISRPTSESFTADDVYAKSGVYKLIMKGTDAKSKNAYLQTTIIVNGQSDVAAGTSPTSGTPASKSNLLLAWPMWILLVLTVVSFWLGERHEKNVLRRRGKLVEPSKKLGVPVHA